MNTQTTTEIHRDCLLHAKAENGFLTVYRSVMVRDTDEIYQPVIELVGNAEPLIRQTISDPDMMFGQAELLTYAIASRAVAA